MSTPDRGPALVLPPFAELFREHAPYVWRALRYLGVDPTDVEDACQEVFLVVHRRLHEYEGRGALRSWLYGICVRVASDRRKSARVAREQIVAAVPELPVEPAQHDALAHEQARRRLAAILATLDDDKRAVFVAHEIEQLPMGEIAAALGCPLQTAYYRLHAARRAVDEAIGRLHAASRAGAR